MSVSQNWISWEDNQGMEIRMTIVGPLQKWKQEICLIYKKKTDMNNLKHHLPTIILLCFEELSQSQKKLPRPLFTKQSIHYSSSQARATPICMYIFKCVPAPIQGTEGPHQLTLLWWIPVSICPAILSKPFFLRICFPSTQITWLLQKPQLFG